MNEAQLHRMLVSVGYTCFTKHYEIFADSSLSDEKVIDYIIKNDGVAENSAKTKTSKARGIIKQHFQHSAFILVSKAQKIPTTIIHKALRLAQEYDRSSNAHK